MPSLFGRGKKNRQRSSPGQHVHGRVAAQPKLPLDQRQPERIDKILHTIQSRGACRLNDLADEFNLSKSYLQHLFKRQTGLRLGHLLAEQKLQRAAYFLKSTNMRIKEIAGAVGYEHSSSFIRAFERRFTETPQTYRHHCNHTKPNK